ncbi:ATP-binding protein [Monashia sp. NPDC004114]
MRSSHAEQVVGHLPLEMNTMVGRRQEATDIRNLLATQRLVTVTGPAGIGKTRTALHVARSARRTFADGAWFVEFASVRDPALAAQVVLETLKILDSSARDPRVVLIDHLRGRRLLLVMDNCEHLQAEVASLVGAVLREVPGAQVLATSIQPLGVQGEATYRIEPLAVPDQDGVAAAADLAGFAAVELFASRARSALGEFEVDASNQQAVVQLCSKLEGWPLAIELAAARLKVMTVDELLRRVDDRFHVLKGTSPVSVPRHQTLLAAVTWSHDLCTPAEQLLWRRASVFTGSFSLDAAERVCSGPGLPPDQVMDALLGLVEKSVVTTEQRGGRMRFRMLEAIRAFGEERLAEAGEKEEIRAAHCAWTSRLLAEAAAGWFGPRQLEWTGDLRLEQANIRSALDFCASHAAHARTGLQLAGSLWFHWFATDYLSEGRLWLERLLVADARPTAERALALGTVAFVATLQGDTERGRAAAVEGEKLALDLGVPVLVGFATHPQALAAWFRNEVSEADAWFARAQTIYAEAGAPEAWRLLLVMNHAAMHALLGELAVAAPEFKELEAACERHGEQWILSYAVWGRAVVSFHAGAYDEAAELLLRSIAMKRPFRDVLGLALAIDVLAWVLAARGDPGRAARLVGAASGLWSTFGMDLFGSEFFTGKRAECEAAARAALGDSAYEEEVRGGAAATLEDTLGTLLVEQSEHRDTRRHTSSLLTRREQEVARLVAEGLSNQEIAHRLVISPRTAEAHVENVLRKLDFRSRAQIASWIVSAPDA